MKYLILAVAFLTACKPEIKEAQENSGQDSFQYKTDQFADVQILRYQVPGFDELTPKQKELAYYLYEAGLSGRDIIYDQNYKHNLRIRKTLEEIIENYKGDRDAAEFEQFLVFAKRVWFSNGIHHHYSTKKIIPEFSADYFRELVKNSPDAQWPVEPNQTVDDLLNLIQPVLFDPSIDSKRVNLDQGADLVQESANNFYESVTQQEAEDYYEKMNNSEDPRPVLYGLNSKLVKENGQIKEKTYRIDGMYGSAIEKIVYWLTKASSVAENERQKKALDLLIDYYRTGDLKTFDDYNVAWVQDTASTIDITNSFIEVYGDAMGLKGSYESVLSFKDKEASQRMKALATNAQWFEDQSPIMEEHKKEDVTGISYKVITVISESGDAAPSTPIGINLPNSNWIRKEYGSKSVSLGNIKDAYNQASSAGAMDEFGYSDEEKERAKNYNVLSSNIHTALHEVIGHGSGQLNPGVKNPSETLKNYSSTLEEARADLVSLYFITNPKLVEIGIIPTIEVGKAEYDSYIRNGLMLQLRRLEPGDNLEESHMRNRQIVASWAYEKGKADNVIERKSENGKTYFVINDYDKLRDIFGELLKEIQRIKSEGDFEAGKNLVENYGVKVDQDLLLEVKERYKKLDSAPYSGFIQPKLVPVLQADRIVDVRIEYPEDFVNQMMEYGENYAFLPVSN
jgi:dipeptidyl-peptidase-3